MENTLVIDYYSDILCVWAWIAQRRIEELNSDLPGRIELRHHYMDIFGDVPTKMASNWGERGGYSAFAEHVRHSAENFESAPVNRGVWIDVKPLTSGNAHLVLKAIELQHGRGESVDMALKFREAFFVDALDVGSMPVLEGLVEGNGLDRQEVGESIRDGTAMAALMHDYQASKQQGLRGSPSYVLDGGRQILYGNVGYRILSANIEELINNPSGGASWC